MKDLSRFLAAQNTDYQIALSEIKSGKKLSHWMWYIFPQLKGLGFSSTSMYYAINDLGEAIEYLNHPILGTRLKEICNELLKLEQSNPTSIFGKPDDLKLKSCMTLFLKADTTSESVFKKVIDKFFEGQVDNKTIKLLK
ncbi:DUF1810 domain-containing protein [Sphingobacteriales bacterium UPWRP_1]|nr:calpastatin [Sphingobacteriales bacterium TSM_CSS]PSJ76930.1 DUF1810 domain-containing protein [Sphingobacteriales bacterium UPWRP_1]